MEEKNKATLENLDKFLDPMHARSWNHSMKYWISLIIGSIFIVGIAIFYTQGPNEMDKYLFQEVQQGNLEIVVSASGTLQPTKTIDVGSVLSGTLIHVFVKENDIVKTGQLLAELDASTLNNIVLKSEAILASAEATLKRSRATMAETKVTLERMKQAQKLTRGKFPSKLDMETAHANLERALAGELSAKSEIIQAQAILKTDKMNLEKTKIYSPIDGVVLARKVEPGQSISAELTVPILFSIVADLNK